MNTSNTVVKQMYSTPSVPTTSSVSVPDSGALGLRPAAQESCVQGRRVESVGSLQERGPAAAVPLLPSHLQHSVTRSHSDVISGRTTDGTTLRWRERDSFSPELQQGSVLWQQSPGLCLRRREEPEPAPPSLPVSQQRLKTHTHIFWITNLMLEQLTNPSRTNWMFSLTLTFPTGTGHDGKCGRGAGRRWLKFDERQVRVAADLCVSHTLWRRRWDVAVGTVPARRILDPEGENQQRRRVSATEELLAQCQTLLFT